MKRTHTHTPNESKLANLLWSVSSACSVLGTPMATSQCGFGSWTFKRATWNVSFQNDVLVRNQNIYNLELLGTKLIVWKTWNTNSQSIEIGRCSPVGLLHLLSAGNLHRHIAIGLWVLRTWTWHMISYCETSTQTFTKSKHMNVDNISLVLGILKHKLLLSPEPTVRPKFAQPTSRRLGKHGLPVCEPRSSFPKDEKGQTLSTKKSAAGRIC